MLFHDRKSGNLVAIDHSDMLPTDSSVAGYKHFLGEHGEKDLPMIKQGHFDKDSAPSRTRPEVSFKDHRNLDIAHETLKARAADEAVKDALRAKKAGK
jgi:hypothetical protein